MKKNMLNKSELNLRAGEYQMRSFGSTGHLFICNNLLNSSSAFFPPQIRWHETQTDEEKDQFNQEPWIY